MSDRLREERLRAEEQHSFLEKVLAASPAGVLTLDFDGRAQRSEPERGALPAGAGAVAASAAASTRSGTPRGAPWRRSPRANRGSWWSRGAAASRRPTRRFYDRGHPRSFFLVEELTEELRATEKAAYEKLIRMITHEVNNSVGAVRSLLESLRHYEGQIAGERPRGLRGSAGGRRRAHEQPERVSCGASPTWCAFPPLTGGRATLRPWPTTSWCCSAPSSRGGGSPASGSAPSALEPALLDKNQLEQVLVNVLKNAMESIGEGGTIALRWNATAAGRCSRCQGHGGRDPGGSPVAAVHPLLQHETRRAGARPDRDPGDPRAAPLRIQPAGTARGGRRIPDPVLARPADRRAVYSAVFLNS